MKNMMHLQMHDAKLKGAGGASLRTPVVDIHRIKVFNTLILTDKL